MTDSGVGAPKCPHATRIGTCASLWTSPCRRVSGATAGRHDGGDCHHTPRRPTPEDHALRLLPGESTCTTVSTLWFVVLETTSNSSHGGPLLRVIKDECGVNQQQRFTSRLELPQHEDTSCKRR